MIHKVRTLLWLVVGLAAIGGIYLALNPPAFSRILANR